LNIFELPECTLIVKFGMIISESRFIIMNPLLAQIKLRPYYFIPSLVLLGLLVLVCFRYTRLQSFQFLNVYHPGWLDLFFMKFTFIGDGLVSIAAVILLAVCNKLKEAVTLLVAYLSSALVAQLLKNTVDFPRPRLYLEQAMIQYQHFVEGVTLYSHGSFPSGHTTSAFAMATIFSLCFKDRRVSIGAFVLATLAGYSRIYLAEHFLPDVVGGAIVGVVFAMLTYYVIWQRSQQTVFLKGNWKKRTLFKQKGDFSEHG